MYLWQTSGSRYEPYQAWLLAASLNRWYVVTWGNYSAARLDGRRKLIMAKHRNAKGGKRRNRKEIRKQKGHVV